MNNFSVIIDEIALEGLDGITLNSLWERLRRQSERKTPADFYFKQYAWKFIHENLVFSFYQLPEPREIIPAEGVQLEPPNDIYPIRLFTQKELNSIGPNVRILGSCKDYFTRKDVTEKLRTDTKYSTYETVFQEFGESLAIVAHENVRIKSLIGPTMDVGTFRSEHLKSLQHYAVLERIGRSRSDGESSNGANPLYNAFAVRPKDMSYVIMLLETLGIVRKQVFTFRVKSTVRYTSFYSLVRFNVKNEANIMYKRMCDVLLYLQTQPDRCAMIPEVIIGSGVSRIKRVKQTYPGVLELAKRVVPNQRFLEYEQKIAERRAFVSSKRIRKARKKIIDPQRTLGPDLIKMNKVNTNLIDEEGLCPAKSSSSSDDIDSSEEDDASAASKTKEMPSSSKEARSGAGNYIVPLEMINKPREMITKMHYRVNDRVDINARTGEWKWVDQVDAEDEDDEDKERCVDYTRRSLYRNVHFEIMRVIRLAGQNGAVVRAIADEVGLECKQTGRYLERIRNMGYVKAICLTEGKIRRHLYLMPNVEHKSQSGIEKFKQLSGINIDQIIEEKERLKYGLQYLERLNQILETLQDYKVMQRFELYRSIRDQEKRELKYRFDHRCFSQLIDRLQAAELIVCKSCKVEMFLLKKRDSKDVTINFVCHRSITSDQDPILLANIDRLKRSDSKYSYNEDEMVDNLSQQEPSSDVYIPWNMNRKRKLPLETICDRTSIKNAKMPRVEMKQEKNQDSETKDNSCSNTKPLVKPKNEVLPDAIKLMTFNSSAPYHYGQQPKMIRDQLIHEFLCYLILQYRGAKSPQCNQKFPDGSEQPPVYLDEQSWRRYLPPLPRNPKLSDRWFVLNDLIDVIPLSLVVMVSSNPYIISGLEDYLDHPLKRHYPLQYVDRLVASAVVGGRRLVMNLHRACLDLCALGHLTLGFPQKLTCFTRCNDDVFYLHSKFDLYDTTTTPPVYLIVAQPMSRYQRFEYDFADDRQTQLFWIHLWAVAASSNANHRNAVRPIEKRAVGQESKRRERMKAAFKLEPKKPDEVEEKGTPSCPGIGVAGSPPEMFLHRDTNWRINRGPFGHWFVDEMVKRMCIFDDELKQRVKIISAQWNHLGESLTEPLSARKSQPNVFRSRLSLLPNVVAPKGKPVRRNYYNKPKVRRFSTATIRTQPTEREKQLIIFIRAAAIVVAPQFRLWVDRHILIDWIVKLWPWFNPRTLEQLLKFSSKASVSTQAIFDNVIFVAKQLKRCKEVQEILANFPPSHLASREQKEQMFKEVLKMTAYIFSTGSDMLISGSPLDKVLELNEFVRQTPERSKVKDVDSLEDILRHVIANVYYGTIALSRRDGNLSAQNIEIFKHFPLKLSGEVMTKLRRNMLITSRHMVRHRYVEKGRKLDVVSSTNAATTAERNDVDASTGRAEFDVMRHMPAAFTFRRQIFFTNHYRHIFFHKFHLNLTEQVLNFYNFIVSQRKNFCSALDEVPGYVPVLASLMSRDYIEFSFTMPESIVKIANDLDESSLFYEASDAENSDDSSTSGSDHTNDDQNKNPRVQDVAPIRLGAGKKVSMAGLTSRNFLQKLRHQQLACFTKEGSRTAAIKRFTMRSNLVGLESMNVSVQYVGPEDDSASLQRKASRLDRSIIHSLSMQAPNWSDYAQKEFGRLDQAEHTVAYKLYMKIDEAGPIGLTEIAFERFDIGASLDEKNALLKKLIQDGHVIKVGSIIDRFVSRAHIDPWTVSSFRIPKDFRSLDAEVDAEAFQNVKTGVKFLARPWTRPDGTLNRPMWRWLCEGVFLRVFAMPGVTRQDLFNQFDIVLDRTFLNEILGYLLELNIFTKRTEVILTRKVGLFEMFEEETKSESFRVTMEGVTRFSTIFAKTSMPDFALTEDSMGMHLQLKSKFT